MEKEDTDTELACSRHKGEGFQKECNLCRIEKEAAELVKQWENEEDIPTVANSRALEMLEWRIIRKALNSPVLTIEGELAIIRKLLAIVAMGVGDLEQAIDQVTESIIDLQPNDNRSEHEN